MTSLVSREVIEELRRQKSGPTPAPKLRRDGVHFEPAHNSEEMARLIGALIMAIGGHTQTSQTEAA